MVLEVTGTIFKEWTDEVVPYASEEDENRGQAEGRVNAQRCSRTAAGLCGIRCQWYLRYAEFRNSDCHVRAYCDNRWPGTRDGDMAQLGEEATLSTAELLHICGCTSCRPSLYPVVFAAMSSSLPYIVPYHSWAVLYWATKRLDGPQRKRTDEGQLQKGR